MKIKISIFIKAFFIASLFFQVLPETSRSGCIKVGADLGMTLSCAEFSGNFFGLSFDFFTNPADPGNIFWKLDQNSVNNAASEPDCVAVGQDLSVFITCAELSGTHYDFTLLSSDPANLLWRLDTTTLGVKSGRDLFYAALRRMPYGQWNGQRTQWRQNRPHRPADPECHFKRSPHEPGPGGPFDSRNTGNCRCT